MNAKSNKHSQDHLPLSESHELVNLLSSDDEERKSSSNSLTNHDWIETDERNINDNSNQAGSIGIKTPEL